MNFKLIFFFISIILNQSLIDCVIVRLYTPKDPLIEYPLNSKINLNKFDGLCIGEKCTNYMIIHGFNSFGRVQWALDMKTKLLNVDTRSNVFIVDWSEGSMTGFDYQAAVYNLETYVVQVYEIIASLIKQEHILESNDKLLNLHCIGHSLGSHFCGFFSKIIQSQLNLKLKRITGLGK